MGRMLGGGVVPYPYQYIAKYYFDGQAGDNWPTLNSCTTAADTTNYETPRNGLNQALRVSPNASTFCNVAMTLGSTIDLSNAQGVLRLYLNPNDGALDGNTALKVTDVGIRLRPQGGSLTLKGIWTINQQVTKGWLDITFDVPSLWNAITLTAIDQIYITVTYSSGYTGYFTLGYLAFWQRPTSARVLLRLDDGLAVQLQLAQIADAYGIPVHFAVIKGNVGNTPTYMTLAEVQSVRDMSSRHMICNHGDLIGGATGVGASPGWRWQDAGQTILTSLAYRRTDIESNRDYEQANGLSEGARRLIVPGGFDQRDDFSLIGSVDTIWYAGLDSSVTHVWPPQWTLHRSWRMPGGTALDAQPSYASFVDSAVANKTFALLYGHGLDATKWTAMCAAISTYRAAGSLQVVTLRDIA